MVKLFIFFKDVSETRFFEVSSFVDSGLYLMIIIQMIQLIFIHFAMTFPLIVNIALLVSITYLWMKFRRRNSFNCKWLRTYYITKCVLWALFFLSMLFILSIYEQAVVCGVIIMLLFVLPCYWNVMMLIIVMSHKTRVITVNKPLEKDMVVVTNKRYVRNEPVRTEVVRTVVREEPVRQEIVRKVVKEEPRRYVARNKSPHIVNEKTRKLVKTPGKNVKETKTVITTKRTVRR